MFQELNLEKREKDSTLNKVLPYITAANVPTLIGEAGASLHGYNQLKRLGADKTIKKLAKKRLGAAFGTYALGAGTKLVSTLGARQLGKIIGKNIEDNNDSKKKEMRRA